MYKWRLLLVVFFIAIFGLLSVRLTKKIDAATLTASSVTLSNSRMSYKALIVSGAAGSSLITINGGSYPDHDTNHLFPGDAVCFTDAGYNGCKDSRTYTVANVIDGTHFNLTTPITTALVATDYAIASQSGAWTIGFTTVNQVPIGGKIIVTIPAQDANTTAQNNDGLPDSAATVSVNGFDMNKLAVANATVTATSCGTTTNWGPAASGLTVGGGGTTDSTITWTRATSICAAGSTVTIAFASPFLVNPAPIIGHTQGAADVYGVTVATTDGTNTIDTAIPRVAAVEAVLISANVDESLSFVVAGLGAGTYCGKSQTITTTATSIPWGHLAAAGTLYYAAQSLTVNTNAASGYIVTIQENDQMGRNGNVCTGVTPAADGFTFGTAKCIRDTVCSAATPCTESVMGDWTDAATYPGLGYSIATIGATYLDAPFFSTQGGRTWNSKQLPDSQGSETVQTIMSNTGPVNNSSIYICYALAISGTQPSGYYYNIAKYTATATF